MKIVRDKSLLENKYKKRLHEEDVTGTNADDVLVNEIDPSADSVEKIADAIQNTVEVATDDEKTVSDAEAVKNAQEIKSIAQEIGAKELAVFDDSGGVKTAFVKTWLTDTLDRALEVNLANRGKRSEVHNVIIQGVPGSGKTSSVSSWARKRGLNLTKINLRERETEIAVSGILTISDERGEHGEKIVEKALTKHLIKALQRENSVLLMDEFNRGKDYVIDAVLDLVQQKVINIGRYDDDTPEGELYFPNLLFCIALCNPATKRDRTATDQTARNWGRFVDRNVGVSSDEKETIAFVKANCNRLILRLPPNSKEFNKGNALEHYLREEDLALFVLGDSNFKFTTYKEYLEMENRPNDYEGYPVIQLSSREFLLGISGCWGELERFKKWVENKSFFEKTKRDMILEILKKYPDPTFEELASKKLKEFEEMKEKNEELPDGVTKERLEEVIEKLKELTANYVPDDSVLQGFSNDSGDEEVEDDDVEDDTNMFPNTSNGSTKNKINVNDVSGRFGAFEDEYN